MSSVHLEPRSAGPPAPGQAVRHVLEGYAAAATPDFVARYNALFSEQIYQHVIDLFPQRAAKIADIGAGTGRDAAWFAARGHDVLAIEPVRELREAGRKLHRSKRILWLDDCLPSLSNTVRFGAFDLVTLCAVWQHLPDADQRAAMPRLAGSIAPGGRLVISLRHGPGGEGRPVFASSPDATIATGSAAGLSLVRRREAESLQEGNQAMGVSWTWLVFEKAG